MMYLTATSSHRHLEHPTRSHENALGIELFWRTGLHPWTARNPNPAMIKLSSSQCPVSGVLDDPMPTKGVLKLCLVVTRMVAVAYLRGVTPRQNRGPESSHPSISDGRCSPPSLWSCSAPSRSSLGPPLPVFPPLPTLPSTPHRLFHFYQFPRSSSGRNWSSILRPFVLFSSRFSGIFGAQQDPDSSGLSLWRFCVPGFLSSNVRLRVHDTTASRPPSPRAYPQRHLPSSTTTLHFFRALPSFRYNNSWACESDLKVI